MTNVGDLDSLVDVSSVTAWDVIWAVAVVLLGFLVARFVRRYVRRALERIDGVGAPVTDAISKISGWFVILLAFVYALSLVGFDTAPIVLAMIVVGIILFLSGRTLAENFGAGLVLQTRAPFEMGDQIDSSDFTGTVLEITSRTVILATIDGRIVHIPNRTVLGNPIVNRTTQGARRTTVEVGLVYGTDLDAARNVMLDTVRAVEDVLDDPVPEVLVRSFDDSAVTFDVRYWHAPTIDDEQAVTDVVIRAVDRAVKARGMTIAFPQRTLWWGAGSPGDDESQNPAG